MADMTRPEDLELAHRLWEAFRHNHPEIVEHMRVTHQRIIEQARLDYEWRQANGETIMLHEMETSHLFFTLRLLALHNLYSESWAAIKGYFPGFAFGRKGRREWTMEFKHEAIAAMLTELARRDDVEGWMSDQLLVLSHHVGSVRDWLNRQRVGL